MRQGRCVVLGYPHFHSDRCGRAATLFCRVLVIPDAMIFFVFGGQWSPMAEFDVETRWIVACTLCDVTVGETSLRRQIETMVSQGACKRLYSANRRFSSVPLHVLHPSCTLNLPGSLTCISLRLSPCLSSSCPSSSTVQTTGSSIPMISCTPHVALIPSFYPSILWQHSWHTRIWLGIETTIRYKTNKKSTC